MSYEIEELKRIRYYIETNGNYAIDQQSVLTTSFLDFKAHAPSMKLNQEQLKNETMMQRADDYLPNINARKRSEIGFSSYLNGSGHSAGDTISATGSNPNAGMLGVIMGGNTATTGTKLSASSNIGMYEVDVATTLKPGVIVGVLNTSNEMECVRVRAYNTSNHSITCSTGFVSEPLTQAVFYGSKNVYLTQDPNTSLQFYVEGVNDYDRFNLLGMQGGIALETPIGGLGKITYTLQGASWVTSSTPTAAFESATHLDGVPPPFVDGKISVNIMQNENTDARVAKSLYHCYSFELTPNITYFDITSQAGVGNIIRKRRARSIPIASGKFVIYETGGGETILFQDLKNGSYFGGLFAINGVQYLDLGLQVGNTAGNTIYFSMPQCQITDVQRVDAGGTSGVEVSFECLESSVNTPASSSVADKDLARSAFTIAWL